MNRFKQSTVTGTLLLQDENLGNFSEQQIVLLQAIGSEGSITKAAKLIGISYKTAWDRIEAMNNLATSALVIRNAGGAKGGGTKLTENAHLLIRDFLKLKQEHSQLLQKMGHYTLEGRNREQDPSRKAEKSNQLRGKIIDIVKGAIDSEIIIALGNKAKIVAVVASTSDTYNSLELGKTVVALIDSAWVILSKNPDLKTSARNNLQGRIVRLIKSDVNTEVIIDLGNEKTLRCTITNTSANELELKVQDPVVALFKASSVTLAVD